jgi:hypothetical protein
MSTERNFYDEFMGKGMRENVSFFTLKSACENLANDKDGLIKIMIKYKLMIDYCCLNLDYRSNSPHHLDLSNISNKSNLNIHASISSSNNIPFMITVNSSPSSSSSSNSYSNSNHIFYNWNDVENFIDSQLKIKKK